MRRVTKYTEQSVPIIATIFLIAAIAIIPTPLLAAIVYDNGPITHSGGSAIGHFIASDDFVLAFDAQITGALVDVEDGPASENRRWDGTVEWWILADNGGKPGSVIASGFGQNITQTNLVESPLGFRDFTVDFDFGQNVPITAGTTYWLGLHLQADYSRLSVFWDHTASTTNNPSYSGIE